MSVLVTGVAGFIGSNLTRRLLEQGRRVVGFDNLCLGKQTNIESMLDYPHFDFQRLDLTDLKNFREALTHTHSIYPITEVWHMAANSDIVSGVSEINVDLRNTFTTTLNTLELMRELNIPILMFASSSAIYGDHGDNILKENTGPLLPISNYGAMKLASEAIISAAVEKMLQQAYIFRFPNVIGVPATHGVILDFVHKLQATPEKLSVLGNGTQQKTYLHVSELLDAMFYIKENAQERVSVYNIGAQDEGVTVRFIAEEVVKIMSPHATIHYGAVNKGWVGDVPRFVYSTEKLRQLGWLPQMNSIEAVRKAIHEIIVQERAR